MPITYEEEGERLADISACANVRAELKMCVLETDCCKKVRVKRLVNEISRRQQ